MNITIQYFAVAREIIGKRGEELKVPLKCQVFQLVDVLSLKYPNIKPILPNVVFSV